MRPAAGVEWRPASRGWAPCRADLQPRSEGRAVARPIGCCWRPAGTGGRSGSAGRARGCGAGVGGDVAGEEGLQLGADGGQGLGREAAAQTVGDGGAAREEGLEEAGELGGVGEGAGESGVLIGGEEGVAQLDDSVQLLVEGEGGLGHVVLDRRVRPVLVQAGLLLVHVALLLVPLALLRRIGTPLPLLLLPPRLLQVPPVRRPRAACGQVIALGEQVLLVRGLQLEAPAARGVLAAGGLLKALEEPRPGPREAWWHILVTNAGARGAVELILVSWGECCERTCSEYDQYHGSKPFHFWALLSRMQVPAGQ
eukprot:CAMPEP_0172179712 /NCGR_PEP_ID=MMETSP1050-20130122/16783_1 /TAXON_ID=233186 /ORGANISM="Cryptomonas curvata, Strain CCAP979/52" /LENGTH=310 /DNA_ID=CAMNT_0012852651 /DNA_START=92 /DNA_END=1024 /DNA_ORIENTATION=+